MHFIIIQNTYMYVQTDACISGDGSACTVDTVLVRRADDTMIKVPRFLIGVEIESVERSSLAMSDWRGWEKRLLGTRKKGNTLNRSMHSSHLKCTVI